MNKPFIKNPTQTNPNLNPNKSNPDYKPNPSDIIFEKKTTGKNFELEKRLDK